MQCYSSLHLQLLFALDLDDYNVHCTDQNYPTVVEMEMSETSQASFYTLQTPDTNLFQKRRSDHR
jgi:hypothetical protein